mgnify:CR=1 FL=1
MIDRSELAQRLVKILPPIMRRAGSDLRARFPLIDPAHFGIMMSLKHSACTITSLSCVHAVRPATMSKSIDTLVERGWVNRQPSRLDRRKVELMLTPEGAAQVESVHEYLLGRITSALAPLSDDDLERLSDGINIMLRVVINMEQTELLEQSPQKIMEV